MSPDPPLVPRMVRLRNFRPELLRKVEPDDGDRLGEFFASLSRETERFFHPFPLTRESGVKFAAGSDKWALIAIDPQTRAVDGLVWMNAASTPPSVGICVRDHKHGLGIGTHLTATLIAHARRTGCTALQLTVLKDNPAVRLYERFGFRIDGEANDAYGPAWHMTARDIRNVPLPGIAETAADVRRMLEGRRIFIVPYCHADWAWTHTARWHAQRYVLVFNEVLDILKAQDAGGVPADAPHAFRWYLDTFGIQFRPFLEAAPERISELQRYVAQGRIAVCGGWANVRPNIVGEETFIRSLVLGRRDFQKALPNADIRVFADATDVAVGFPQLPQVLRLAGFEACRFWRPHTALSIKGIPFDFVWEAPDGSRIICSRGCYAGILSRNFVPPDFRGRWDDTVLFWWRAELERRTLMTCTDAVVIYHGTDDNRPLRTSFAEDAPLDLPALMEEWNRRESAVMRFATPNDVIDALKRRAGELPVVRGSIDPCDVSYNAAWNGSSGLWRLRDRGDCLLAEAERWSMLAALLEDHPWPEAEFARLWRELLTGSAHATQWLFENDYRDMHRQLERVVDTASALCNAMRLRVARWPESPPESGTTTPSLNTLLVFNPLPWPRRALVRAHVAFETGAPPACMLMDDQGLERPFQILQTYDHAGKTWEWDIETPVDLPAHGIRILEFRSAKKSANSAPRASSPPEPSPLPSAFTITHGRLHAEFCNARLVRLRDPETNRTVHAPEGLDLCGLRLARVDVTGPLHVGPILETLSPEWDEAVFLHQGPLRFTVRRRGRIGPHEVELDVSTFSGLPRVEWRARVRWAGWDGFLAVAFPVPFPAQLRGDVPFGIEEKNVEAEPYGTVLPGRPDWNNIERQRRGMFYASRFVTAAGEDLGLTFVSHDGDRYWIWDAACGDLSHILINSLFRPEKGWEQHVNTGMEARGQHTFQGSLVLHPSLPGDAELVRLARELRNPPDVLPVARAVHPNPERVGVDLLRVDPENVVLTAALMDETDGALLRMYEVAGRHTTAVIRLPVPVRGAYAVDFLGRKTTEPGCAVENDRVTVDLRPYQIAAIRVQIADTH